MNSVILIGRLTRDPSLTHIPATGLAVTKFMIAVDKGYTKKQKEEALAQGKPTADFIKVVTFGKQAENCSIFIGKGNLVAVRGSISTDKYKADNRTVYTTEIIADRVEFLEGKKSENASSTVDDNFSFGGADFDNYEFPDDDVPFR